MNSNNTFTQQRLDLVNNVRNVWPGTDKLILDKDGFFLSKEHKTIISDLGSNGPVLSHTVPNSVAGNLLQAKVIVISANVGAVIEDRVFEQNADNPTDPYLLDDVNVFKELTFSKDYQRIFLPQNKMMENVVDEILNGSNPQSLYLELLEKTEALLEISPWKNEEWKLFHFYAYIAFPLMNTKYSFDPTYAMPPISLLFNSRYSNMSGNGAYKNDLKFDSVVNIGEGEWVNFVENDKRDPQQLVFRNNAWLAENDVKTLNQIMVLQEFPYRTMGVQDLERKGLTKIYQEYLSGIKGLLTLIREHNLNNESDSIKVVLTRTNWFDDEVESLLQLSRNEGWLYKTKDTRKTSLISNNVLRIEKWLDNRPKK